MRSQLIPQEDYNFISAYETCKNKPERDEMLNRDRTQTARSIIRYNLNFYVKFFSLITDVAKDQIIRYVLTVFDDMLQVRIKFCSP